MGKKHRLLKTITVLNAFSLGGLFLINRTISAGGTVKNILKPDSGSYFHSCQGNVFYRVDGTGEQPLLLIHDANVYSSGYEWNNLVDQLGKRYRVYTMDLLGCGRSDKPGIEYTNYLYVQLISDFIREVIGESTVLSAAGLSSSFAVMAAHVHPDQIKELKLINPVSLKQLSRIPGINSKCIRILLSLPVVGTSIYHILCSRQNLEYNRDEKDFYNPFRVTKKLIDASYEASHIGNGQGKYFQASKDGMYMNWDITQALRAIKIPVTVAYGEHYEHGEEIAQQYHAVQPGIRIVCVPDTKGIPQIENPALLASLLFAV